MSFALTEWLLKQSLKGTNDDEPDGPFDQLAEQVVDGLLMVGRAEFRDPIKGTSDFARQLAALGPEDKRGCSLRRLELKTSLFQYSCSYPIYTVSFAARPDPLLERTRDFLLAVSKSNDNRDRYSHLSSEQRLAILQILRDTKIALPAAWNSKMMDSGFDM